MNGTIFWDFDGTLAYRPTGWAGALLDALREVEPDCAVTRDAIRPLILQGFPWHTPDVPHLHLVSSEIWWESLHPVFVQAYVGVGRLEPDARRVAPRVREYYLHPPTWAVFDDVAPTLDALAARGWQHVIVSNHVPELPAIVEALGLAPWFAGVVTSASVGFEKPRPEIFHIARDLAGNPPRAWMIGDNYVADVQGAEAVGIPAILVRRRDERARWQRDDLRSVVDIIDAEESPPGGGVR